MSDIREQATREHVARWLHTTYGEWRRTWDGLSERGREVLFKRADELGGMFAAAPPAPEANDSTAEGSGNVGVLDWALQVVARNGYVAIYEPVYKQQMEQRASAPHIVAAELRRLAAGATAELDGWVRDALRRTVNSGPDSPAYRDLDRTDTRLRYHRDTLLRRADELDGGAR